MLHCFQAFTELIILKVLEAHRDEEKDVSGIYYRVTKVLGDTDYVDIKMRVASTI